MRFWKRILLFYLGGSAYMTLEFLWRGRSHGSMFLLGGTGFLLLGRLRRVSLPAIVRGILGAGMVTGLEFAAGLLVNRDHRIWDYRRLPLQFRGQICLPYSLLWIPVSLAGMFLHAKVEDFLRLKEQ